MQSSVAKDAKRELSNVYLQFETQCWAITMTGLRDKHIVVTDERGECEEVNE